HVGLDTFAPVTEEDVSKHQIHTEWCQLSLEAVQKINATRQEGRRIVAVGTTSVRVLETAAQKVKGGDAVGPLEGPTDLYILPGYRFRIADALVTNFHLPRSTLIMLVSAFAGREKTLYAYEIAIREKYRFYSFGDAMLIL
ncbi:MAG: tRNA preQ1(34) S-adenosylmethionine ribosyltransferase-isomerase QueA, partial [Anaerolineales bacterium]